jgi:hypothetical protein
VCTKFVISVYIVKGVELPVLKKEKGGKRNSNNVKLRKIK